jgi:hypothetical protein
MLSFYKCPKNPWFSIVHRSKSKEAYAHICSRNEIEKDRNRAIWVMVEILELLLSGFRSICLFQK